jgi:tetratricopeptide (TPR) repeat protein
VVGQGSCATGAAACIAAGQALAFVHGRLVPTECAAIEHRIEACPVCRAVVAQAARSNGNELVRGGDGRFALRRALEVDATEPSPPLFAAPTQRIVGQAHRPARRPQAVVVDDPPPTPGHGAPDEPGAAAEHAPRDAPGAAAGRGARVAPGAAADLGLAPGEVVGRYVVERPLGAGGMGVVSLAHDPELRRPVVIKLVHPNMGFGEGGDELEARLRREAQAMAQLSHSNVVQIFDIGRRGDRVFLAMEFIAGHTLDGWLRARPRSAEEILAVFCQAGAGLAAAHRAGLVHRDFKPSNVLVGGDGVVKVTDFGLARSFTGSAAGAPGITRQFRVASAPRLSGVHAVLTDVNSVVGTPAYMAPEQAAGQTIDARTDQYTFAVTLLDALLGQSGSRRAVPPDAPPPEIDAALERARIAAPIRAAILRALASDPAARFPAIDELLGVLAVSAPAPMPSPRRRTGAIVVAIVGLALCGGAAAVWFAVGHPASPACTADAPARWAGPPRARVIAALAAAPRPFAGWDAERIAGAIDGAVAALAAAELAECNGTPVAGSAGPLAGGAVPLANDAGRFTGSANTTAACMEHRTAALTRAVDVLSASPPPDDPWGLVRAIEQCDPAPDPASAALRVRLQGASGAQARGIADAATRAGDELLAADAFELAGLAALAAGDATAAEAALVAMKSAGQRAGNDAPHGRALLHLINVARWSGKYADARRDLDELAVMLDHHGHPPREELAVALVAGDAFTELGDVATAFAAWDRAGAAAATLGDRDAALTAAIGHAWSTYALRFDPAAARGEATAALAAGAAASPAARAPALGIAADLAIATADGSAAMTALAEAHRLVPARDRLLVDRLRTQRARALIGQVDDVVAGLVPAASDDALAAARIEITRGKILLAADHANEARDVLEKVSSDLRGYTRKLAAMAVAERTDLELAVCDAELAATDTCKTTYRVALLITALHPRAPVRARLAVIEASGELARQSPPARSRALSAALDILVEARADKLWIAELRWQIAQLGAFRVGHDHIQLARDARAVFDAAGRADDVAAIDRWLAEHPAGSPPTGDDTSAPPDAPPETTPAKRDPWGPQP